MKGRKSKFFLNELPWWAQLDSGYNWSWEERAASGVIMCAGFFFSTIPIVLLYFIFTWVGLDKHNSSLIAFIISVPPSLYIAKVAYRFLWPEFYGRAEANAKRRLAEEENKRR